MIGYTSKGVKRCVSLNKRYVLDVKQCTWKIEDRLSSVEAWKVCNAANILISKEHNGGIKVETFLNYAFLNNWLINVPLFNGLEM